MWNLKYSFNGGYIENKGFWYQNALLKLGSADCHAAIFVDFVEEINELYVVLLDEVPQLNHRMHADLWPRFHAITARTHLDVRKHLLERFELFSIVLVNNYLLNKAINFPL